MSASVTSQPCEGNLSTPSVSLPALSLSPFSPVSPPHVPPGRQLSHFRRKHTHTHICLPAQTPLVWICSDQQPQIKLNAGMINCFTLTGLSSAFHMTWKSASQSWNAIQISPIQDSLWTLRLCLNLFWNMRIYENEKFHFIPRWHPFMWKVAHF